MARDLPTELKATRILLFAFAGLSFAASAGTLISWGAAPGMMLATFLFVALPGAAALLFGVFVARGGPLLFWLLIVMCGFWVLSALSNVAAGPAWMIQILWPIAVLALLLRRPSRDFLLPR
ncbi:hypothetical protein ACFOVU_11490 [Nocardiopsis sediminis]|uniref:DUF4175 domain-containing protein n=1 Tax=Nocardiopsis sediminis TaxID=1778267 RepID=A0ABV8FL29_9ACTN